MHVFIRAMCEPILDCGRPVRGPTFLEEKALNIYQLRAARESIFLPFIRIIVFL